MCVCVFMWARACVLVFGARGGWAKIFCYFFVCVWWGSVCMFTPGPITIMLQYCLVLWCGVQQTHRLRGESPPEPAGAGAEESKKSMIRESGGCQT